MTETTGHEPTVDQTVRAIVAARPSRARVFERWGLDYCCGGKTPLGAACRSKGLDEAAVLRDLRLSDAEARNTTEPDWTGASIDALIDHIVTTHHAYLRSELPRLTEIIGKVVRADGDWTPSLVEVAAVFGTLRKAIERHTSEEECVLFPLIKSMHRRSRPSPELCASIRLHIEGLEEEHDQAGADLATLRILTDDYSPPPNACNTYRAMLDGLAELEADMHRHVHMENSILFPRALELAST